MTMGLQFEHDMTCLVAELKRMNSTLSVISEHLAEIADTQRDICDIKEAVYDVSEYVRIGFNKVDDAIMGVPHA